MNGRTKLSKQLVDDCTALDLSPELVAAWLHVRGRTVERWKRGETIPPKTALVALHERLEAYAREKGDGHEIASLEELLRLREVAVKNRERGADR